MVRKDKRQGSLCPPYSCDQQIKFVGLRFRRVAVLVADRIDLRLPRLVDRRQRVALGTGPSAVDQPVRVSARLIEPNARRVFGVMVALVGRLEIVT